MERKLKMDGSAMGAAGITCSLTGIACMAESMLKSEVSAAHFPLGRDHGPLMTYSATDES